MGKDRIYNADQIVLFHNQLPSRTFAKIENAKGTGVVKQITSK